MWAGLADKNSIRLLGTIWGFTAAICVLAFIGKFGGCALAARYTGFSWREASTIGTLMSCKGSVHPSITNIAVPHRWYLVSLS